MNFGPLTLISLFGTGLVLADCSALISKGYPSGIQFCYVIILPVISGKPGYQLLSN